MSFTEMRTVERAVIEMLSSTPLGWRYERGETVTRRYRVSEAEVLLEPILKQKLQELNPDWVVSEGRADMVVSRLKGIRDNVEWLTWLRGDKTMKFSPEEPYVNINLIDFDEIDNNDFLVTNQLPVEGLDKTRYPDMLLYVNGIPLVDIEAKTASRGTLDWREGAKQTGFYQQESIPQLFYSNAFGVGVDELNFRYGVPGTSLKRWHPWRTAAPHEVPELDRVKTAVYGLFHRGNFLDMLRNFIVFEQEEGELKKKVARYQQFGIANELLARAKAREQDPEVRRGLAWQTQGSGKSMAMLCAARKLWYDPAMAQPTILVVVDRQQLLDQMTAQFFNTNTETAVEAHTIRDLRQRLEDDYRGIIVTTVQRFDSLNQVFPRDNIVVMADEAHRSQEGDLGTYMRYALPNASMFGFTGTPIERDDMNTPRNWGRRKPDGSYERYMDPPYRIKDALEDEAIVPIHYQLRLSDWRVHREDLDAMFERVFANHSDAEKAALKQQGSRLSVILKHPERISKIAQDVARNFKRQVRPNGFKAMLVCHDKETCDLYKTQLDALLGEDASFVVISEDEKRDPENVKRHYLGSDQRRRATDEFKDVAPSDPAERARAEHRFRRAEIVIVCDMLLTGFNAPIVQTMYLDKGLTDYRLLQAIARINRPYTGLKEAGVVLDYYGVFEDLNGALNFEQRDIENAAFPYQDFRDAFAEEMAALQNLLSGFERSGSRDSLMQILVFLGDNPIVNVEVGERARDVFETHFKRLRNLYEILSPDGFLQPYLEEYKWLSKLFVLYRKEFYAMDKVDIDELDGQKTRDLVRDFVDVEALQKDFPSYTLDADYLIKLETLEPDAKALKIETTLTSVLTLNGDDEDLRSLSERLSFVIERKREGSLVGAKLIGELEELSREFIRIKKEDERPPEEALALAARGARPELTPEQADAVSAAMLTVATYHLFPNWFEQPHMEEELFRTFTLFLAADYYELKLHLPAFGFVERAIRILKKRRYIPQ